LVETFKILNNIDKVQHEHIYPISRTATRGYIKEDILKELQNKYQKIQLLTKNSGYVE
jgi:hypothetical protein